MNKKALRKKIEELVGVDLLRQYDATWQCERRSETWRDCPTGIARDKEFANIKPCRSCRADNG